MNKEEIPMFHLHTGESVKPETDDEEGDSLKEGDNLSVESITHNDPFANRDETEVTSEPLPFFDLHAGEAATAESLTKDEETDLPPVRATVPVAPVERRPPTESADNSLSTG